MRVLTALALAAGLAAPAAALAQSEETRPPNRPVSPAFTGQTRAPKVTTATRYQVLTLAKGLVNPWGLAFLPDGRMLVTERPGRLRIVGRNGALSARVAGVPAVAQGGQLGLYALALDP